MKVVVRQHTRTETPLYNSDIKKARDMVVMATIRRSLSQMILKKKAEITISIFLFLITLWLLLQPPSSLSPTKEPMITNVTYSISTQTRQLKGLVVRKTAEEEQESGAYKHTISSPGEESDTDPYTQTTTEYLDSIYSLTQSQKSRKIGWFYTSQCDSSFKGKKQQRNSVSLVYALHSNYENERSSNPLEEHRSETEDFADKTNDNDKAIRIMVICGIHGRELFTSELCKSWIIHSAVYSDVTRNMSNEEIARIDWAFVPVANPTGRDIVVQGYRSKKNYSSTQSPQEQPGKRTVSEALCHRGNWRGVDLNRNWRTYNHMIYTDIARKNNRIPRPEEYPGTEAFSEGETVCLRNLIRNFAPHILLAIHSGETALFIPHDDSPDDPKDIIEFTQLGRWLLRNTGRFCKSNKCKFGKGYKSLYPSYGTLTDFAYRHQIALLPFTLEIYKGGKVGNEGSPCFSIFNPPLSELYSQVRYWTFLWKSLYYMNTNNLKILKELLSKPAMRSLEEEAATASVATSNDN